jgi:2-hydroxychromene-2-carboxylate isomerase
MSATRTIEYFYSAHSAYAYLGAWELERIAATRNATVIHRPFDFHPVVDAAGGQPFPARSERHKAYFFGRELRRWAELRGLPILTYRPTFHDNPLQLANGAIIAAGPDADRLSRAILQAHWRDDADIADQAVLAALARGLGIDADALLARAMAQDTQARHQANTAEAITRGIFGSPTYFVAGDMFYGQDRLMMVERALDKPFAE